MNINYYKTTSVHYINNTPVTMVRLSYDGTTKHFYEVFLFDPPLFINGEIYSKVCAIDNQYTLVPGEQHMHIEEYFQSDIHEHQMKAVERIQKMEIRYNDYAIS